MPSPSKRTTLPTAPGWIKVGDEMSKAILKGKGVIRDTPPRPDEPETGTIGLPGFEETFTPQICAMMDGWAHVRDIRVLAQLEWETRRLARSKNAPPTLQKRLPPSQRPPPLHVPTPG